MSASYFLEQVPLKKVVVPSQKISHYKDDRRDCSRNITCSPPTSDGIGFTHTWKLFFQVFFFFLIGSKMQKFWFAEGAAPGLWVSTYLTFGFLKLETSNSEVFLAQMKKNFVQFVFNSIYWVLGGLISGTRNESMSTKNYVYSRYFDVLLINAVFPRDTINWWIITRQRLPLRSMHKCSKIWNNCNLEK